MAYSSSAVAPRAFGYPEASTTVTAPRVARRSVWSRIFGAIVMARHRQADREIARYLSDCGGKITDQAEREIERRFLSMT